MNFSRAKILVILLVCLSRWYAADAQNPVIIGDLTYPRLELKQKAHYYLSDVEDKRKPAGSTLGHIIHQTRSSPLQLNSSLQNTAFDFWSTSLRKTTDDAIPLVIVINELSFTEKREAPGRIKGEAVINVQFLWYRNYEAVQLTGYNARSNYTRPETKTVHEDFLVKMMGDALVFFDKWMSTNLGKNPRLVRNVRLVFEDDPGSSHPDTVFYSADRPLRYDDFRAAPRPGQYAAMVFTSLSYEGSSRVVDNVLEVIVKVKVYVVKSMSWMKAESKNPRVLKHEQTHFDIAKIAAERFKKQVMKLDLTIDDHDSQIQYQFLESYREMHKIQEAYDKDTRHGLNQEVQSRWEEMVRNELEGKFEIKLQ